MARQGFDAAEINELLQTGSATSAAQTMSDHDLIDWARRIRQWEARMGKIKS
jgi:hypothetical protein